MTQLCSLTGGKGRKYQMIAMTRNESNGINNKINFQLSTGSITFTKASSSRNASIRRGLVSTMIMEQMGKNNFNSQLVLMLNRIPQIF
jgi:hypothetical protein